MKNYNTKKSSESVHAGQFDNVSSGDVAEPVTDPQKVMGQFLSALRNVLGDSAWRAWASGISLGSVSESGVVLYAPNSTHCERMLVRIGPRRLNSLWRAVDPLGRSVELMPDPNPRNTTVAANDGGASDGSGPSVARLRTFANFVVGGANKSAATAARAMCGDEGVAIPLLYLYGEQGVGKTHLLTAIESATIEADASRKVMYFNAERFRTEYVRSINDKTVLAFKEEVCQADILLLDDLHAISGSKATEGELFNIINQILANDGRVVVAADRLADDLAGVDERLVQRLSAAVACHVSKPDLPLRRRILERMVADNPAMRRNQSVPEEVVDFIACAVKDTPRALEAALATVLLQTVMMDRPVSLESAKTALQDMLAANTSRRVTVDEIQKTVAEYHGIKVSELLSRRRTHDIVRPRQQAMYLCKVLTSRSLPDIGRRFGNMDHTTVLHAYRRIDRMYADDPRVRADVDAIRRQLRQSGSKSARG